MIQEEVKEFNQSGRAQETYANRQQAHERASPASASGVFCSAVRHTPSGRFTCVANGNLIKPSDFKQPNAEALVQVVKAEHGNSEISCVIDQDSKGFLRAIPMRLARVRTPLHIWLSRLRITLLLLATLAIKYQRSEEDYWQSSLACPCGGLCQKSGSEASRSESSKSYPEALFL